MVDDKINCEVRLACQYLSREVVTIIPCGLTVASALRTCSVAIGIILPRTRLKISGIWNGLI
jgi:hypothetical protein